MKTKKLIFIELNELNFDEVKYYVSKYDLKNFKKLLKFNYQRTLSEKKYNLLEPWIQWVTIHTGLSAKQHKVFHLGDISKLKKKQIFEIIESKGFNVGVISAMNSINRLKKPKYFIPDPWTKTTPDHSFLSRLITNVLSSTVKKNTNLKLNVTTILKLLYIFFRVVRISQYTYFFYLFLQSIRKKWFKAIFLDYLINEIHLRYYNKFSPNFSTVFFNAAAHIQHHYFLMSKKNLNKKLIPEWYISKKNNPFKDVVKSYDKMLEYYLNDSKNKFDLILATGLTQTPVKKPIFYWKIKKYDIFLDFFDVKFIEIRQLMSRDFVIYSKSSQEIKKNFNILNNIYISNKKINKKEKAFKILKKRKDSIFVTLTYSSNVDSNDFFIYEQKKLNMRDNIEFVAIKNGEHHHEGYFFTNIKNNRFKGKINIKKIHNLIINYFTHV